MKPFFLAVSLGGALNLVLLLDGVGVGATLGGVHDLVGKALGHGLEVTEGGLAGTLAHHVDGLVDATEGGDVDGLTANDTTGTDTGGVLTGTTLGDGIDDDLDGVLLGHQVDDLEGVLHEADGLELASVTAHLEHESVAHTLDDGAASLVETALLEASAAVGDGHGGGGDVLLEGKVGDLNVLEGPLVEELGGLGGHFTGCL